MPIDKLGDAYGCNSGRTGIFQDSALPISNDAHCQRVARLAAEIAHRLSLDARSIHIVSEAAIQHHAVELVLKKNERVLGAKEPGERLESLQTLRIFYGLEGPKPSSPATTLFAEILQLANTFDEKFEWRIFESGPGGAAIEDINLLGQSGLWSLPVHQAFQAIFAGSREQALAKAENLPSSIVSKIQKLALSNAEELAVSGLERLALTDPVLSTDLLQHVNSARYSPIERIGSVREALAHIGTVAARDVMLASTARGIFASSSLHRLWKHSIRCANTMSLLAALTGLDQHQAFLLGLLHDIGRISLDCLDSVARSGYTGLCETEAPAVWIEMATAGCDHAELGADLLAQWNFPESITESIRCHHSPELSAERLTSLLYLVESTEGENEDLSSERQFEAALSRIQMSHEQFKRALEGRITALAG